MGSITANATRLILAGAIQRLQSQKETQAQKRRGCARNGAGAEHAGGLNGAR